MASSVEEHETQTLAMLRQALADQERVLTGAGLVATPPRVVTDPSGKLSGSSEVVVEFMAGDDIVDVIEFDLLKDGRPAVPLAEVKQWLSGALADVVRRRIGAF